MKSLVRFLKDLMWNEVRSFICLLSWHVCSPHHINLYLQGDHLFCLRMVKVKVREKVCRIHMHILLDYMFFQVYVVVTENPCTTAKFISWFTFMINIERVLCLVSSSSVSNFNVMMSGKQVNLRKLQMAQQHRAETLSWLSPEYRSPLGPKICT